MASRNNGAIFIIPFRIIKSSAAFELLLLSSYLGRVFKTTRFIRNICKHCERQISTYKGISEAVKYSEISGHVTAVKTSMMMTAAEIQYITSAAGFSADL